MATINDVYRASGTLVASTVDTVNLSGRPRQVTIVNRGTGDIFISTNPSVAPAGGGEEYVIPSNTTGGPYPVEPVAYNRTDASSVTVTNGSATVADPTILGSDRGELVTGTGIPANTFVGLTTDGVGFTLTDQNGAPVLATANGSSVTIRAWRSVIQLFSTGTPAYSVMS